MTTTEWPADVTARYLTLAGSSLGNPTLAVDIRAIDDGEFYEAVCATCGANDWQKHWTRPVQREDETRRWAQRHAETCRAMPRPADH